jgi:hypothetical protein
MNAASCAEHDALLLYHVPHARRRLCSTALQDSRSSKQCWIALSRSFGFAEKTCRDTLQIGVARLRIASRESKMDR